MLPLRIFNIGEDEPDENSPAWIEPSIYLGSSFIMSESGALPKLLEGTKINVFVEWEGEHRDLGGPFQDWPFWTLVLLMPILAHTPLRATLALLLSRSKSPSLLMDQLGRSLQRSGFYY